IIKLVFAKNRDIAVHEIFQPGERIDSDFAIIRTSPELIRGFGKEDRRSRSGIYLHRTSRILLDRGWLLIVIGGMSAIFLIRRRMAGSIVEIPLPTAQAFSGDHVEGECRNT